MTYITQTINRRTAIRNLLIIAGGALVVPACYRPSGKATIALVNLDISEEQEALLADVAGTLLPETDTKGAQSLLLHLFVLKMADDCYGKDDQQLFTNGLSQFSEYARQQSGQDFRALTAAQKEELLLRIQKEEDTPEAIRKWYGITKSRTIQGYMNSKYVMTDLAKYELVPGRYNGYFPA
jgi:hypothetical protein